MKLSDRDAAFNEGANMVLGLIALEYGHPRLVPPTLGRAAQKARQQLKRAPKRVTFEVVSLGRDL